MSALQSSSIQNVIIKLATDYPPLLDRIIKFADAINYAYNKLLNGELYIEVIQDGILYIIKDWDAFVKIHKPLPKIPEFIKKKLFKIKPEDEISILGSQLRNSDEFPKDGIRYFLTCPTHNLELLLPTLNKYYSSIHPDIKIELIPSHHIIIHFTTYGATRRYFELSYYISEKGPKELYSE